MTTESMKPYPAYKDSGIEWIGKIPEGWDVVKAKHTFKITMGQSPNSDDYNDTFLGYPFLQGNAEFTNLHPNPKVWCEKANKIAFKNDILVSVRAPIGAVNIADQKYGIGRGLCAIKPNNFIHEIYLYYLFLSLKDELNRFGTGSTYTAISTEQIKDIKIPVVSIEEQAHIGKYIDSCTNKIDTLIENKQKQIELLKEERTAIINQAVTKGLNPDVPMRDSGIEWLGEIPEHWAIVRLKLISNIRYGLGQPPRELEGGLPIIRATNINRGTIDAKDLLYVDPKDIPYDRNPILKADEIIVVRSGAYTGDSAIIPTKYEGSVTGYDMVVSAKKANPKYIAYSLLSNSILHNQIDLCKLRAAQPHLNAEELGNILVFLPPDKEQDQIVESIIKENQLIESTIQIINNQVEYLQEYRTALISEAVTGKIDLRNQHETPTSK